MVAQCGINRSTTDNTVKVIFDHVYANIVNMSNWCDSINILLGT